MDVLLQPVEQLARRLAPWWPAPARPEETLVADARAGLTPNDMVERKLMCLLSRAPLGVRHARGSNQGRGEAGRQGPFDLPGTLTTRRS
jgi:hypothetical protein